MFGRYFMIFGAVLVLAACGDKSDEANVDMSNQGQVMTETYDYDNPEPGTEAEFVVNVGDRVFFDYDSFDLRPEARVTLENQAEWLKRYSSLSVTVEGHADERGTREYNLALGERRANSVKNYLVALGISPSRISTVSYGKERPDQLGSNDYAWSRNRRAVTDIQ